MLEFDKFDVLSFDCYGTLIDWEQGILTALRPLLAGLDTGPSDLEILEIYAAVEASLENSAEHRYRSYVQILLEAQSQVAVRFGIRIAESDRAILAASVPNWPPFADTVGALKRLKKKFKLAIISNIDDDLFAGSARHLKVDFDWIITAQQCRVYKPSPAVFEQAFEVIGVPRERILHVAQSHYHDIAPMNQLGLNSVWVNRRGDLPGFGATPVAEGKPDIEVPDLATLASLACRDI